MPEHRVDLTAEEWAQIDAIGHLRNDWKEAAGVRSVKARGASELAAHILGIMGEMCFARWTGLPIDETERRGGDGGVDFKLRCGLTVDVKTNKRPDGDLYLLSTDVESLRAHVVVLVTQSATGGIIRGWANQCDLLRLGFRVNWLGRPDTERLCIAQSSLHDLKYLQWFDQERVIWDWATKSWQPTWWEDADAV